MDIKATKERFGFALEKISHPFQCFFNPSKNRYFFKKYLGNHDNDEYISVDTVFNTNLKLPIKDLSVFVKMDIEGREYKTLHDFKPFYHFINGFAVEFHKLDVFGSDFTEIVREKSEYFYVAHVHANNYGGYIYATMLPDMLEVTFINKKLVLDPPVKSTCAYPVPWLDFACNPQIPDIPIAF
jgi:hypothetical protein